MKPIPVFVLIPSIMFCPLTTPLAYISLTPPQPHMGKT